MASFTALLKALPAKPRPTSDLLTEKEAAEYLGVSVFTVQRERKRGSIGHAMIGSRARYGIADLHAYVESKSTKPCQTIVSKSGTSTSPVIVTPPYGKPAGSMPMLDKHAALALAQKTFSKPKKLLQSS